MSFVDDNTVESGPCVTIEYAIRADGSVPAKDDLEKLRKRNGRVYSRFKAMFKQYVKTGCLPEHKFNAYTSGKGEPTICKFRGSKVHPYRIPCFLVGDRLFLTHVFKKKGQRKIVDNIEKARRIRTEHLKRVPEK